MAPRKSPPAAKTRSRTRTVTSTTDGRKFALPERVEAGLVPCPGEAHKNPYIDNCMICAPKWGEVMSYVPLTPEACTPGVAVPVNYTESSEPFQAAEKEGKLEMVQVTEKRRGCESTFFAWVAA